jgi:uncharacterized protein YidB (DUF937 family)
MKALTFSSGTVEEFIMWKRDHLLKICVGQHVTDAAGKFTTKLNLVSTYTLYDQLVTTWSTQDDHLNSPYLKIILQWLLKAGLKEYLSSWITRDEIQPISNKVEAIQNIAPL